MANLYSHGTANSDSEAIEAAVEEIEKRLINEGDTELGRLSEKLKILEELSKCDLGRFLILNRGYDGLWSHYIAYEFPSLPRNARSGTVFERGLIETVGELVFRSRLDLIKALLQKELFEGISLLSLPCGVMAELTKLDFSKISSFHLCGVDLDIMAIEKAKQVSKEGAVDLNTRFSCQDAWSIKFNGEFNIALCMGLTGYIGDNEKLLDLYRLIHKAIKPGGKFMVSYISPWNEVNLSVLDPEKVRIYRIVWSEIIKTRTVNRLTKEKIIDDLKIAGFVDTCIYETPAKICNIAVSLKLNS